MPRSPFPPRNSSPALLSVMVFPDFGAVDDAYQLGEAVGAMLIVVLAAAVFVLVVSAAGWAIAQAHGNYRAVAKARAGLWVAVGSATLAGAGVAWGEFLLDLGQRL